ncbi:MAG: hypothetical protein HY291_04990 [Planctomycetes bacterium]|nr:hypothetical protein [Planctomycetota bacterium]
MTEQPAGTSNYTGLWVFLGLLCYAVACIGGIYLITGELVGEKGFKAILAGSIGSLFGMLLLGALVSSLVLDRFKDNSVRRARVAAILSAVFVLAVAYFAWSEFLPLAKRNPASFYGAPDSRYEVTFTSGAKEIRSGAQLGMDEWSWWVGFYFSIVLVNGALGLWMLGSSLATGRRSTIKESQAPTTL